MAPRLLGCWLWCGDVAVRLVEVEAYEGEIDPASHAYRGRTPRNATMFGPAGHLYVYQMHGHHCCNVVSGDEGVASGILLRAGEVVAGLDEARTRRPGVPDARLARGPGNLTRALGITRADDGCDLTGGRVRLVVGEPVAAPVAGPRVNVSRAAEVAWRFWDADSPSVSAFKQHPAARRPAL